MTNAERPPAPKASLTYVGLLALSPLALAVIGWFSIRTVDAVENAVRDLVRGQTELVKGQADIRGEVNGLRATMDGWAKQSFVPREIFDVTKADYERRLAALEGRPH